MVPWIDPEINYMNFSELAKSGSKQLAGKTFIIMKNDEPVAVLVPYKQYLELQALVELPVKAKAAEV